MISVNSLLENILQLDEVNNSVFQITTKEPIAYIIFIRYLQILAEELSQLVNDISAIDVVVT